MVVIIAIPLAVLSKDFDKRTAEIIEGVSKVVAAIAIVMLSLKIPKWLGFYKNKKKGKVQEGFDLSIKSVRFNVAWNIWREIAECGVFLLPSFLKGDNLKAIPLSAFVGIVVGLAVGFLIYWANKAIKRKMPLAIFITLLLVFLSTGLFVGGCHEFEEVWGETHKVWKIANPNMSHKQLPMVLVKPFGYSSSRTVLQIACFWSWLALSACLHGFMMWRTKKINRELAQQQADASGDIVDAEKQCAPDHQETEEMSTNSAINAKDIEAGTTQHDNISDGSSGEIIDC